MRNDIRLDRIICNQGTRRRDFVWIPFYRVLGRVDFRPYSLAMANKKGEHLPSYHVRRDIVQTYLSSGSGAPSLSTQCSASRTFVLIFVPFTLRLNCPRLELTIWLVPSLIENAIAACFIGFFFGPVYPVLSSVASVIIPHWLLQGAIGWYGATGMAGAAFFPFITGALSSNFGIVSLQPL